MERWEPPKPTADSRAVRRRPLPETERRHLPEIWLMVALRSGITLFLIAAVVFQNLRDHMHFVFVVLIGGLGFVAWQTNDDRTRRVRNLALADMYVFLAVIPVVVLSGFVAAQTGDLMSAESSALMQTTFAGLLVIALLVTIVLWMFWPNRSLIGAVLIPPLIMAVALLFVLHDYRSQTVLAMITIAYFLGAFAIALAAVVQEPLAGYLAPIMYAMTIAFGVVLLEPGLGNLAERAGLIQVLSFLITIGGLLILLAVATPGFDLRTLTAMLTPARFPANRSQADGGTDDPTSRPSNGS